jgi:hypothetical protein
MLRIGRHTRSTDKKKPAPSMPLCRLNRNFESGAADRNRTCGPHRVKVVLSL